MNHFIFTTLAANQTAFFIGVGKELEKSGSKVSIISFHEGSDELLKSSKLEFFNIFDVVRSLNLSGSETDKNFAELIGRLKPKGLE